MRSVMLGTGLMLGMCLAGGAAAQERPRIDVAASGMVELPPEIATIQYSVRGEGATPDDATRAMVARKEKIEGVLAGLRDTKMEVRTDQMRVREVRGPECRALETNMTRAAAGACAVQGAITEMRVTLKVSPVAGAGTITGMIAQAGGSDVAMGGFEVRDRAEARRKAMTIALANGKAQAEAIARASGATLGPLIRVFDSDSRNVLASDDLGGLPRVASLASSPVPVSIAPDTVKVFVQFTVSYELVR